MADPSEDDAVGYLGQEMVLEVWVVNYAWCVETVWGVAGRFEADEFGDWNFFFETREAAWWEVQLLYEDGLVH